MQHGNRIMTFDVSLERPSFSQTLLQVVNTMTYNMQVNTTYLNKVPMLFMQYHFVLIT